MATSESSEFRNGLWGWTRLEVWANLTFLMKHLSEKRKRQLIRHARLRLDRRLKKKVFGSSVKHSWISVPQVFDLHDNYDESVSFINGFTRKVLIDHEFVGIDFRDCTSIYADAALVLAAEVDRCVSLRTYRGNPKLTGTYPKDAVVGLFLQQLGFYKLLNLKDPAPIAELDDPRFISMMTGVRDKGKVIGKLAELVFGGAVRLDSEAQKILYRGLSEAMSNVTRHAYDPSIERPLPVKRGQWWMAGYWDQEKHEIMAFMYDQGVGIPATLPKTHADIVGRLRKMLHLGESDGDLIQVSMRLGESKSGEQQHGRGMADLKRLVELSSEGHLRILSRSGQYLYVRRNNKEQEHSSSCDHPIAGTFIEWRISDSSLIKWR